MNIQEEIKSTVELTISKKIVLNFLFTEKLLTEKFNELLKPFEISNEQYNVLRILRGQKGKTVNMFVIQERMIAKNSNTTRLIDKLLIKGLVTRNICEENRRKIEISITKNGLNILSDLDQKVINYEQSFSNNLNENELVTLNTLIEKYRTFIDNNNE